MTALTKDRSTVRRDGLTFRLGVAATAELFAGSMVALDATGFAVPAADTAGLIVVGRAEESVDNGSGADGDLTIKVQEGVYLFASAGLDEADVGKPAFVSDDQTIVTTGATNNVHAGIIVAIESATEAWIRVGISERAGGAQANSSAGDIAAMVVDFNLLLAKLRAARLIGS